MTGAATKRLAIAALVTLVACALAAAQVSSAPAESGSAMSSKQGKKKGKKKKKKKNKKKGKQGPQGPQQPAQPQQPPQPQDTAAPDSETLRAVFVGNNWEGTADILSFDAQAGKFTPIARLNIIPDEDQEMSDIAMSPDKLAFFLAIRMGVGEGNDQFVDDMYSTNDGRLLVVSRPSFADVIGLDLATGEIVWEFSMEGYRSDHMGVSPDGQHVAVSDSTGNVVHVLEMATGEEAWQFPSGDSPHENTYSRDGSRIFHASIGRVYTPTDQHVLAPSKGAEYFQIVDAEGENRGEMIRRITNMGQKIEDDTCGPDAVADKCYSDMSSAIRPMAISPDERFIYFQVSFFHGFIEYDVANDRVLRVAELPDLYGLPRETYILDSAHHGIAMDAAGTKLCVAGTMSDYAAIVSRTDFEDVTFFQKEDGARSYWSTTSADGGHCFVSWSGLDSVAAINYETEQVVDEITVGDPDDGRRAHPQRVRTGVVRTEWAAAQGG
jgi:hypothetical protein